MDAEINQILIPWENDDVASFCLIDLFCIDFQLSLYVEQRKSYEYIGSSLNKIYKEIRGFGLTLTISFIIKKINEL